MKRTTYHGAVLALSVLLVSGGAGVAQAASEPDSQVATLAVSAEDQAGASDWTPERMEAAIPFEDLVAAGVVEFDASGIDLDYSGIAASEPVSIAGQDPVNDEPQVADVPWDENGWTEPVEPVSHIGKLFFSVGNSDSVCSANAVVSANANTIATAAHCVSEGDGEFYSDFVFVPAYENGAAPYGTWPVTEVFSTSEYHNGSDINYDVAFATVDGPGMMSLADTVGSSGIGFNHSPNLFYTAYGYPAADPFDGETLHSCSGDAVTDNIGTTTSQGIPCTMTTGASGGPWFIGEGPTGLQNSVNSFAYTSVQMMWGPYFGDVAMELYNIAQYA